MKKFIVLALVVAIGGALYLKRDLILAKLNPEPENPVKQDDFQGKLHYEFTELDEGLIAKSGDYVISSKEIESAPPMKSFAQKKKEVLFVLLYKQFVIDKEKPPSRLELSFEEVNGTPEILLKQYGMSIRPETKITFDAFPDAQGLAKIDGEIVSEESLNYNNFIWAAYETELFRYKLTSIDQKLKRRILDGEAKKLGMTQLQYKEKYVYGELVQKISDSDIQNYMKKYAMDNTEKNRQAARDRLLELRKRRGVDYILERFVMDLPVQVNLKQPEHKLEAKHEWTPYIGPEKGELEITLFSGTRNPASREMLSELIPMLGRYKNIGFYYRPMFSPSDEVQHQTSQVHLCVWMNNQPKFWDYFLGTLKEFKNDFANLYAAAKDRGLSVASLKKCLAEGATKEVVDDHLKYASFLGIHSGPVIYVGGEVLYGPVRAQDVEKVIQRQLGLPTAGLWSNL